MSSRVSTIATAMLLLRGATVFGQLEILSAEPPPAAFGGETRAIQVVFRNPTEHAIEITFKTRLFQLSSATRAPIGTAEPWKRLAVLPGQTVLETVRLKLPALRTTTEFEVDWLDDEGKTLGQTLVTVYPTNLLKQLVEIVGDKPPGIFDPHERLTPLLRSLSVEFDDLTEGKRLATWSGRLAILGPFAAKQAAPRDLSKHAAALAGRGVNVLTISPLPERGDSPGRAPVVLGQLVIVRGRIVAAPPEIVADLGTNPLAQERLLALSRLSLSADLSGTETLP